MDHDSYEMKLARQCGQLQSHMAYLHLRLSLASSRGLTPVEVKELAEVAQKSWAASRDELDKKALQQYQQALNVILTTEGEQE